MNSTIDFLMNRKSMRVFENKKIEPEVKSAIIEATMRAPTAGNSMLYSILDITDQSIKDTLAKTCDNQPFIATAPMILVFLSDYRRWYRKFVQAKCADSIPVPQMGDFILAANDCIIAAQTACMAAESFGIGSCYIGDIIENFEIHKELLNIPEFTAPVSMVVFGYPTQQQIDRSLTDRFPTEMIVFENKYRDLSDDELTEYKRDELARAFYKRKYIADFSVEMNRSAEKILKNWSGYNY